jgi:hypothetical protein
MSGKPIHITAFDLERLRRLLSNAQATEYRESEYLEKLKMELDRAIHCDAAGDPTDSRDDELHH